MQIFFYKCDYQPLFYLVTRHLAQILCELKRVKIVDLSVKYETLSRIRINQPLKEAGWRFFDNGDGPANILLENHVKITQQNIDAWGNCYEKTNHGFLDFLLVDHQNKPICVRKRRKKESLQSLVAKEQSMKYDKTVGAGFISPLVLINLYNFTQNLLKRACINI